MVGRWIAMTFGMVLPMATASAQFLGDHSLADPSQLYPQNSLVTSGLSPHPTKAKTLETSWSSFLKALDKRDELANSGTYLLMGVSLSLKYDLTPYLNMTLSPSVTFQNGHVQAAAEAAGSASSVDISEASTNIHDKEWINLSVGALNTAGYLTSVMIDGGLAFPAVRLNLQAGQAESSFLETHIEGAVPTSSSLTSETGASEATPSFLLGGIRGQFKNSDVTIAARANAFNYRDLPMQVAKASGPLGNTVDVVSDKVSHFIYEYRGYEGGMSFRWDVSRKLGFEVGGSMIHNTVADPEVADAKIARASMDIWSGATKWTPSAEYFSLAPDATVAYYASPDYQPNRQGRAASLAMQFKKLYKVKVRGGEKDIIFQNPSLSYERFVSMSIEILEQVL